MMSQYYDSANITESKLSFRRTTSKLQMHKQEDSTCMTLLYGIEPCVTLHRRLSNPVD